MITMKKQQRKKFDIASLDVKDDAFDANLGKIAGKYNLDTNHNTFEEVKRRRNAWTELKGLDVEDDEFYTNLGDIAGKYHLDLQHDMFKEVKEARKLNEKTKLEQVQAELEALQSGTVTDEAIKTATAGLPGATHADHKGLMDAITKLVNDLKIKTLNDALTNLLSEKLTSTDLEVKLSGILGGYNNDTQTAVTVKIQQIRNKVATLREDEEGVLKYDILKRELVIADIAKLEEIVSAFEKTNYPDAKKIADELKPWIKARKSPGSPLPPSPAATDDDNVVQTFGQAVTDLRETITELDNLETSYEKRLESFHKRKADTDFDELTQNFDDLMGKVSERIMNTKFSNEKKELQDRLHVISVKDNVLRDYMQNLKEYIRLGNEYGFIKNSIPIGGDTELREALTKLDGKKREISEIEQRFENSEFKDIPGGRFLLEQDNIHGKYIDTGAYVNATQHVSEQIQQLVERSRDAGLEVEAVRKQLDKAEKGGVAFAALADLWKKVNTLQTDFTKTAQIADNKVKTLTGKNELLEKKIAEKDDDFKTLYKTTQASVDLLNDVNKALQKQAGVNEGLDKLNEVANILSTQTFHVPPRPVSRIRDDEVQERAMMTNETYFQNETSDDRLTEEELKLVIDIVIYDLEQDLANGKYQLTTKIEFNGRDYTVEDALALLKSGIFPGEED